MSNRKAPAGTFWRGNTLWGRKKVRGRKIRWSLRTSDPVVARRRRKKDGERLVSDTFYGDAGRSFDEVLAAWTPFIADNVGARTAERYASSLDQIKPWVRGKNISDIDGQLINEIIEGRKRTDGVTNATVKRDLVALSSVLNFAFDKGWVEGNPVLPRMRRLKERRDPIVLPEPESIQIAIKRVPGNMKYLVRAAVAFGCRQSEMTSAGRSQFDSGREQLTVIGKGRKLRVIETGPFEGTAILRSMPAATGNAPLFWHGKAQPYRNLSSRFSALVNGLAKANKAFRPFRFHDLRHYHAVQWLKSGRSIYDLQHRLGHKSIKTTEIYLAFLTPEEQRIAKLGANEA